METVKSLIQKGRKNFIFLGEAGSGKSEIAINFAEYLQSLTDREIHFFDMDMTKPLFRSRDVCSRLEADRIQVHFEEQFMDAPTLVGGGRELLRKKDAFVVMDVGGDHIGARSIGGLMAGLNRENTVIYYVLNAFRPWSGDIEHIDGTLGRILSAAHLQVEELHLINNPNLGASTGAADVLEGARRMEEIVSPYMPVDFTCVKEELWKEVKRRLDGEPGWREMVGKEWFPIRLYLTYPWAEEQAG